MSAFLLGLTIGLGVGLAAGMVVVLVMDAAEARRRVKLHEQAEGASEFSARE